MRRLLLPLLLVTTPAIAQRAPAPLSDGELAAITGRFMLANGAQIAMSVTSDTLVNGQIVLRSVLTVDQGATLRVFGAAQPAPASDAAPHVPVAATAAAPSSVTVLFDRRSGMQTVTPNYSVGPAVAVTTGGPRDPAAAGLAPVAVVAGGPAVATAAGLVTLAASGSRVTLSGDRIDVTHVLGPAIATAIANTGNDRVIDNATSIDIDLSRTTAFAVGGAALRVSDMALDATRGMVR